MSKKATKPLDEILGEVSSNESVEPEQVTNEGLDLLKNVEVDSFVPDRVPDHVPVKHETITLIVDLCRSVRRDRGDSGKVAEAILDQLGY